jgi:hypothetical protein
MAHLYSPIVPAIFHLAYQFAPVFEVDLIRFAWSQNSDPKNSPAQQNGVYGPAVPTGYRHHFHDLALP